jgi:tryptophan-rich hypothetical protein
MEKLPLSNLTEVFTGIKSNPVSPKKLLLSKWTAVTPVNKEKHFLVVEVIQPELIGAPIQEVTLEAALTGRTIRMPWRALKDTDTWRRGWI